MRDPKENGIRNLSKRKRRTKNEGKLDSFPRPNHAIPCDIAETFKKTKRGSAYLLIVTDMFTS
jgi:hypothetical protein